MPKIKWRREGASRPLLLRAFCFCSGRNSSREPEALDLRLETGAKNLGVERILEAVAHERCVVVFNIHVEVAHMGEQEIQNRAVVGQSLTRQHHLIWAFLIELTQPSTSFVRFHDCLLDSDVGLFSFCSKKSRAVPRFVHLFSKSDA